MKKGIIVTGRKDATLAFHAKHKPDGSVIFRAYPIRYSSKSRKPIDYKDYDKKDAVLKIKFENIRALDTFLKFVNSMRDNAIYIKGQGKAYLDADKQIHNFVKKTNEYISHLEAHVEEAMSQSSAFPHGVHIEVGHGLENMPDDVFAILGKKVADEASRRMEDIKNDPKEQKQNTQQPQQQAEHVAQ